MPGGEGFDAAYLALTSTTTAARCPELLRELVALGLSTVIAIPTPNASRVIAPCDLADAEGRPSGRIEFRSGDPPTRTGWRLRI
jgi:hypothetical protein